MRKQMIVTLNLKEPPQALMGAPGRQLGVTLFDSDQMTEFATRIIVRDSQNHDKHGASAQLLTINPHMIGERSM